MKVTRHTPDRLVADETPWLLGSGLAAFVLASVAIGTGLHLAGFARGLTVAATGGGIGLAAMALFVRRIQMVLDARADAFVLRRESVLGRSEMRHALSEMSCAILEEATAPGGGKHYNATMIFDRGMSAGRYPVVAEPDDAAHRKLVETVNLWLYDVRHPAA